MGPREAAPARRRRAMAAARPIAAKSAVGLARMPSNLHAASSFEYNSALAARGHAKDRRLDTDSSLNTFWPVLLRERLLWRASVGSEQLPGQHYLTAADQSALAVRRYLSSSSDAMATIPDEITDATDKGDVSTVRRWLEAGGNPNLNLTSSGSHGFYSGFRPLLIATSRDRGAIVGALLKHGADTNYLFTYPTDYDGSHDPRGSVTALSLAARRSDLVLARLLLDHGAARSAVPDLALETPRLLRMFLMAGGDVRAPSLSGKNPEQYVRQLLDYYQNRPSNYQAEAVTCAESLRILEGVRRAGSYKNYVLQDFKGLLRLRSLLARNRARINDQAPEVVARLFGGRTGATRARPPAHRRARPLPPRMAGVPDPAFWLVMEYWRLGDWRRPSE